jgi:hypothetical protein
MPKATKQKRRIFIFKEFFKFFHKTVKKKRELVLGLSQAFRGSFVLPQRKKIINPSFGTGILTCFPVDNWQENIYSKIRN